MSNEMLINLFRKIYKEHKEAIDMIIEHGKMRIPPDKMDLFHKNTKTIRTCDNAKTNMYYSFIPEEWKSLVPDTNPYVSDKYLVYMSFNFSEIDNKKIILRLDIGEFPDKDERKRFIEEVNNSLKEKKLNPQSVNDIIKVYHFTAV